MEEKDSMFSKEYLEWVKWNNGRQVKLPPLTNTQHQFTEWMLLDENKKEIRKIGGLDEVFISVRQFIKERL